MRGFCRAWGSSWGSRGCKPAGGGAGYQLRGPPETPKAIYLGSIIYPLPGGASSCGRSEGDLAACRRRWYHRRHVRKQAKAQKTPKIARPAAARPGRSRPCRDCCDAAMVETIREVYERYGFEPVETPAFEYTDALGKFLPDQDRPNEGVFSLQDDDEQWISPALRSDRAAGALCRGEFRRICQNPIAATATARSSATKSPAPAGSASSCSSTPTRWAAPRRPPTPRCA